MAGKVVVLFKQTGDAPIVAHNKVKIDRDKQFKEVVQFLCKQLKRDSVFVYLRSAFSPSLDEKVATLFDAYATNDMLVVNYALTPAWG
mmetsp:Transcript_7512/g.19280  ORF Transcript_7512/g.19280 Transcript_7512/m.19280 type:complete len:88 (+) Transcript_7512:104-367(+)|eukprot:jgi/Tetstr1/423164/TSEL_013932.t1